MPDVVFSRAASADLKGLPENMRSRALASIDPLAADPRDPRLDILPLKGSQGEFRIRLGSWRILFRNDGETITIVRIASRGSAYR